MPLGFSAHRCVDFDLENLLVQIVEEHDRVRIIAGREQAEYFVHIK